MSVFTDSELGYLAGQRLGRIATVGPDGQPHVVPTSFRYNAEHDAIDVGGLRMSQTKKLRDVQRTGRASIVIDDVLPPWQPRMIEVRGSAAVIASGGKAFGGHHRPHPPHSHHLLRHRVGRRGRDRSAQPSRHLIRTG
jgi:pyridoxamine 5'-phosphate oxidase family protein